MVVMIAEAVAMDSALVVRGIIPENLSVHLKELAKSPFRRPFPAKHGSYAVELQQRIALQQGVFNNSAQDARGGLGPEA